MSSASWALQQAIFAELAASSDLQALVGDPPRIFDAVPREAAFPYVIVGDDQVSDWSTATESGSEHLIAIHVWSRAGGRKEAKAIADVVRARLDGAALTLTGQTLIDILYQGEETARETDGETFHAAIRFRAVIEPSE
ncbi:MAG TPA: DUF3168 domain-containing protein [Rhizomicrobium sp.]|jgi:hypothetical protein|nr:DUF3168 domain-containing protein [Rhizomicrobium sp.]